MSQKSNEAAQLLTVGFAVGDWVVHRSMRDQVRSTALVGRVIAVGSKRWPLTVRWWTYPEGTLYTASYGYAHGDLEYFAAVGEHEFDPECMARIKASEGLP